MFFLQEKPTLHGMQAGHSICIYNSLHNILYVQEVVTLQKKYPIIFASEN